jgi:hypothetical protein
MTINHQSNFSHYFCFHRFDPFLLPHFDIFVPFDCFDCFKDDCRDGDYFLRFGQFIIFALFDIGLLLQLHLRIIPKIFLRISGGFRRVFPKSFQMHSKKLGRQEGD